jgi:hypothetical protein
VISFSSICIFHQISFWSLSIHSMARKELFRAFGIQSELSRVLGILHKARGVFR